MIHAIDLLWIQQTHHIDRRIEQFGNSPISQRGTGRPTEQVFPCNFKPITMLRPSPHMDSWTPHKRMAGGRGPVGPSRISGHVVQPGNVGPINFEADDR